MSLRDCQTLINEIPGIVFRCALDADRTMHLLSDYVKQLTGYAASDLINNSVRSYASIIHPEDLTHVSESIKASLEENATFQIEYRLLNQSGDVRWVMEQSRAVYAEDGGVDHLNGVVLDISAKKRLKTELQQSENLFQKLVELSPDPVWIIENNRFVECNQSAVDMLGYADKAHLLNTHPSTLSPEFQPDGLDSFSKAEQMMALARDKGVHRFEWVHTRANHSDFHAEVTLSSTTLQGRPILYCMWRDITERKLTEDELRLSEERFRGIVENITDWVWELDLKGNFTYVSSGVEEILGYDREEVLRMNAFDLMSVEE